MISPQTLEKLEQETEKIVLFQTNKKQRGKHRWLWQFVKDLLNIGDPCIQWEDEDVGVFTVHDQLRLGAMWCCYRELSKLPYIQVFRQFANFFGLSSFPNRNRKIYVKKISHKKFQFEKTFFMSNQYSSYNITSHIPPSDIAKYMETRMMDKKFLEKIGWEEMQPKPKIFCQKGCGSEYLRLESRQNHESVCTYKSKELING